MKRIAIIVFVLMFIAQTVSVYATECYRDDKGISEKEWIPEKREEVARVFPDVADASGEECEHGLLDFGTDKVLVYDLASWYDVLDTSFDANQIVIYAHQESLNVLNKLKTRLFKKIN